jgi:hypothetical protein
MPVECNGVHRNAYPRLKAREIIDQIPHGGYMTTVEHWRQQPDGQIKFTMRRLRTAD